jgi:hypothetical protein
MAITGLVCSKLNGLLAALLVVALFAPTLDTFACAADQAPASVVSIAGAVGNDLTPASHDQDDKACIHGHCHHGVGVAKLPERVALGLLATEEKATYAVDSSPSSSLHLELLRPPRG